MIVAAGLSPAWQQVLVFDDFQAGEVNRAQQAFWCGSGKVLNVGVTLHHLSGGRSGQTLTLSTLGGAAYDAIEREFGAMGMPRRWIRTASPTRVCTTLINSATATATELVENAGPVTDIELSDFERTFAETAANASVVVLTGSLPNGAPADFFLRLLRHVDGKAVLDVRGAELLAALEAKPYLVKPNRDELSQTLGTPISNENDVRAAITELQRRGAQAVVVTAGKKDLWLGSDGKLTRFTPALVDNPVNPIGCGDCLAAGIAWRLEQGCNLPEAVERGMACAKSNLLTLLPSDLDGRRQLLSYR